MLYRDAFRRMKRDRLVVACMVVVAVALVVAVLSAFTAIVDPPGKTYEGKDEVTGLDRSFHPPSVLLAVGIYGGLKHDVRGKKEADGKTIEERLDEVYRGGLLSANAWKLPFGADKSGRSVLAMSLHGLRWAFIIGFVTTAISVILAVPIGAVAGYFGGITDDLIVWGYTTVASIPFLLLLVAIMSTVPDEDRNKVGTYWLMGVIGVVTWTGLARLIRAEFMKHKQREYVQACRALGYGHARIIFSHILPNVSHIAIITFTIGFISSVNTEVFLTFIGAGAGANDMTWGQMITAAKTELTRDPSVWWPLTAATVMLFVLSLAFSIFGDALRDALDPKLKT